MKLDPEVWGNVFPELVGADETRTRPILGFRINRVELAHTSWEKPSVVLRSMRASGYSWEAGRNEAGCLGSPQTVHGQFRHRAPATNCGCGLYAVHDIDQLSRFTDLASDDFVLAGVAGTGIVRVHTDGWRAQFARIVAFSMELAILEIPTGSMRLQIPTGSMRLLDALTPRERRVVELRFGLIDGHRRTLEQVGKRFGVAREKIRDIEATALVKLQHPSLKKSVPRRLSATLVEALEAKYQVPVVPMDRLKEVMAGTGNFWEEMR